MSDRKVAEQGSAKAQFSLGVMYRNGEGVPQNYAEEVKWYRKAAEQGYAYAQYGLGGAYFFGKGVPEDFVQAHMWRKRPASPLKNRIVSWLDVVSDKGDHSS